LALFAEGPSDYAFLQPLLGRLAQDLCNRPDSEEIDVVSPLALTNPAELTRGRRVKRVCAAAQAAAGQIDVLFIHADGDGNAARAEAKSIAPAVAAIAGELPRVRSAPVVPVREMEAWCLADGEALCEALHTRLAAKVLELPEAAPLIEKVQDPKARLAKAVIAALGERRAKKVDTSALLRDLGELVSLEALRDVPSFRRCEIGLDRALVELGFISEERTA
jgi:hypothetical protein